MTTDKIANIYVFCDRWCERCAYGSRCEAYAADETIRKKEMLQADDEKNRLFWESIHLSMQTVFPKIEAIATNEHVDLDIFEGLSKGKKFDLFQHKAVNNEVLKAGRKYEDAVDDWLDTMADEGELKMMEFLPGSVFRVNSDVLPEADKNRTNNLVEIVMRYQLQIYLKLSRLYYTRGREMEEGQNGKNDSNASNGAAKMVLELINRSVVAWWGILQFFPSQKKSIHDMLFLLMRLKKRIEKEFPQANEFIRPGFDENL